MTPFRVKVAGPDWEARWTKPYADGAAAVDDAEAFAVGKSVPIRVSAIAVRTDDDELALRQQIHMDNCQGRA